eukprot:CAMPEP_0179290952 /NCGR_PEP_ID=MMETSP0797-20121207/42088_1 /TAXON_ID=47934 /ORGANISM="Dinophysis acuminata, Strain DAEP01" /LENGTH=38 /DNA_ID= /DNA_START= /DNA_END= /DNA_ORIENTATION=
MADQCRDFDRGSFKYYNNNNSSKPGMSKACDGENVGSG